MIDVRRIWNVIYNARSNRSHPPTSRSTAPATQNDCDDWSASHMKRHLQWAEQQESQSIFTKYCTCHAKWMPSVVRVTYETSFPMRGASKVTLQTHQLLRLPRKMNLMIDPRHIWNVIYNARSNRVDASNFTKYCACHAKCISWLIRVSYETSFRMRGASKVNLEPHQILPVPRKMHLMIDPRHIWNVIYNARSNRVDASNFTKYCACHAKCISWLIRVSYETSFRMRGASKVNLEPHQILPVPRKMNLMIDPRHIWNVI